jgi:hypothetical protein
MNYEAQLQFKQKEVLHNIKNLSGMGLPEIDNIQAAPQPYFYRNKMEYAFSNQRWLTADEIADKSLTIERKGLGFHKAGMWDKVVDIRQCHLQAEPANEIRNAVKAFALEHQLDFFNPRDQEGFLRSLMIRNTKGGSFMVLIQFFRENKAQRENLLDHLKKHFDIASLLYCINSKANDSLYDQEIICYDGENHIVEEMEGLQFKINAKSFFQTANRPMNCIKSPETLQDSKVTNWFTTCTPVQEQLLSLLLKIAKRSWGWSLFRKPSKRLKPMQKQMGLKMLFLKWEICVMFSIKILSIAMEKPTWSLPILPEMECIQLW